MKREIKFRGKRVGGEGWLYGDLNHIDGKVYIFDRSDNAPTNSPDWFEVSAETVGQYIGVKGKEDRDLYEDDIVSAWSQGFNGKFVIKMRLSGSSTWLLYPAWQNREYSL